MALELMMEQMRNFNYNEDDTDYEEKDDSEDEREYSDYDDNKDDTDFEDLLSQNEDIEVFSLQNLCLKSITKNFDKFNTAYATSEDTTLRRNLLFLQRVYSDHMITEREGCITDSCLNFLLNEHLKELHLEMFCNCSEEAVLKRLSEIGHGFVKGHLNYTYTGAYNILDESPLVKKAVILLPNVHVLHIPGVCDDEILQLIASSCPKLQELHIDDSKVTDEGVKSLFMKNDGVVQVKCHLKILSVKNTAVLTPGIRFLLENMPSLQTLNHSNVPLVLYSMHKDDMRNSTLNTAKEYNLTSLDLMNYELFSDNELSNILTVCARMCPHVKSLCSPVMVEKNDLYLISLFSELEDLSLDGLGSTNLNINNFLKLHGGKLKELKLSYFSLSVPILLQSCPKLESLNLRDITFQWEDKDETSNVPCMNSLHKLSLEHFIFQELRVEKSISAILNSSPKLELLDMAHCEFADSGMREKLKTFCANSTLQDLHFRCSDICAIVIECILLTCSSLRTLVIRDCENILSDNIDGLYEIIHSKKDKVNIIWSDDRSELNSIDDDFFDNYDFADDSDDYYLADYEYYSPYDFDEEDYGSDY